MRRRVVRFTLELHAEALGQVRLLTVARADGVPVVVVIVEVQDVAGARRHRRAELFLRQDLLPRSVGEIDDVVVVVVAVPRHELPVRHVRDADGSRLAVPCPQVGHVGTRELNEAPVAQNELGAIRALLLVLGAHLLHRLQLGVLVVPDVHFHRLGRIVGVDARRRRGAEEEPAAVLRELEPAVVADDHRRARRQGQLDGDVAAGGRRDLARGVIELVARGRRRVVVAIADEGELAEFAVEGEAFVVALSGEQRAARSIADPADESAVVRRRFRRHRVHDPVAVLGDHVFRDFRDRRLRRGRQVADDQVGARIFLLFALARDAFFG